LLEGLQISFWVMFLSRVLVLDDGEGNMLVAVAVLGGKQITKDCGNGLRRSLVESGTEGGKDNGVVTVFQSSGESGADLCLVCGFSGISQLVAASVLFIRRLGDTGNQQEGNLARSRKNPYPFLASLSRKTGTLGT